MGYSFVGNVYITWASYAILKAVDDVEWSRSFTKKQAVHGKWICQCIITRIDDETLVTVGQSVGSTYNAMHVFSM